MREPATIADACARQGRLVRKELSEILRDRRTIVTLVLMPLLVYPLLSVGFMQFFRAMTPLKELKFVVGSEDRETLLEFRRLEKQFGPALKPSSDTGRRPTWILLEPVASADAALKAGEIDLALSRVESPAGTATFGVTFLKKSTAGPLAAAWVDRLMSAANAQTLDDLLKSSKSDGVRMQLVRTIVNTDEGDGMMSLSSVIPFILILMTITGAVYPAIDLTAGERERGTLEILVAAPVPRINVLIAKYVAVVFVAVMTAAVNIAAMTATMMLNPIGHELLGGGGLSATICVQLFGLLLLFAMFFSAALLTITSFARSFKEAQAYLIPVMLVAMAPGAVGLMPDLKLSPGLAVTPLVNIVLLGRDVLDGKADLPLAALVVGSTLLYAAAALALATRVFGAEAVLYNERNSWSDLVRRPPTVQSAATPATALWSLAVMVPTYFLIDGLLSAAWPTVDAARIGYVAALVGWPALFAWRERVDRRTGFAVRWSPWQTWLAALLLGGSIWAASQPLVQWLSAPADLLAALLDAMRRQRTEQRALVAALFLLQAIAEEFYFRGYLWNALERSAGTWWTLIVTSLLFGLAHVVTGGIFGLEKLVPTALLGVLLGIVRWRSGSVLPGLALHVLHNAILISLGQSETSSNVDSLPWHWWAAALAATGTGLLLLIATSSRSPSAPR